MDTQNRYQEAMEDPGFKTDIEPQSPIIKVVGVGGGGCNAVSHMYNQKIQGVSFVVCNTDRQALNNSPVPVRLLIGPNTTQGLGAGNDPEVAKAAAEESEAEVAALFDDTTKMVFITAGMGGGTGTGAAPVVAEIARELGVLTVGVVTKPFAFEGPKRARQAEAPAPVQHPWWLALLATRACSPWVSSPFLSSSKAIKRFLKPSTAPTK